MRVEKKTEACQYGPRARLPRQGEYSRPHQSQEIVKPTPNSVFFVGSAYNFVYQACRMHICAVLWNLEIGCAVFVMF